VRAWGSGAVLFLLCVVIYSANGRVVGGGDCWAIRYIPVSIIREGNLDLNEYPEITFQVWDWTRDRRFRVPLQPVLTGIFAVPLYLAASGLGVSFTPWNLAFLGKLASTLYTAFSAVVLLALLRRRLSRARAYLLILAYAFGTCVWTVSSQDLWQHGFSHLLISLGLYCLFSAESRPGLAGLSGFFLSLAALSRGMNVPLAAAGFACVLIRFRSQTVRFLLWCLPGVAYYLSYNLYYLGSPGNPIVAYALGFFHPAGMPGALAGLLFSPGRGMLFFSPFLLLALPGAYWGCREPSPRRVLYRCLSAGTVFYLVFLSSWYMWWGGHCYGYRMLVDLVPVLLVLMVPAVKLLDRRFLRRIFLFLVLWSVLLQAAGALYYCDRWNGRRRVDKHPERLWWIADGQLEYMLRRAAEAGWRVEKKVQLPRGHRDRAHLVPPGARCPGEPPVPGDSLGSPGGV